MQQKKLKIWLPFLFSLAIVLGMFFGFKMRDALPGKKFFFTERKKPLEEVLSLINANYVDKVDEAALADTAIQAMLLKLDPHSQYIPAKLLEEANDGIAGNFYGIGIEFDIFDDTLNVISVLKDGPADRAGIKMGDKLLKAGDSLMAGKGRDAQGMRDILKGNRGSLLTLRVLRKGDVLDLPVTRDFVSVSSVDASYLIAPKTGFIRLSRFTQQSYREFMEALDDLKKQGIEKLILDLRGNGGGVLDEAVEIADEFLPGDKLITYTEGFHTPRKDYRTRRTGQFETGELIVLGDEGSASASEILMGALQDWDRATIVGRKTFGKGLVQEQFNLSDGSAVRLTVSRYYTPLGRSIQRPYTNGFDEYYAEVAHRDMLADSTIIKDSTPQVKGFSTPKGKVLFAEGGITPDHRVGTDTSKLGYTTAVIFSRGLVSEFGYKYTIDNLERLKQYKDPNSFNNGFRPGAEAWQYFEAMAAADSIDLGFLKTAEKNFIQKSMRLSIARQLWRNEGYFEVMNKEDEVVLKALSLLKN